MKNLIFKKCSNNQFLDDTGSQKKLGINEIIKLLSIKQTNNRELSLTLILKLLTTLQLYATSDFQ